MDISSRQQHIMSYLLANFNTLPQLISMQYFKNITERTLQRDLNELIEKELVIRHGEARAVSYEVSDRGRIGLMLPEAQLEDIFSNETRKSLSYDFSRLDLLKRTDLFNESEFELLDYYNSIYQKKLKSAPQDIIKRERERIAVELSWKSSQFEGNTYSLLETETLIKEGIAASGKSKEETTMVINHKKALDFSEANRGLFTSELTTKSVISLHKLLAEGLFDYGIRARSVGITGSVYKPLDNKFKLEEELDRLCKVINSKDSVYEKALLAFTYICYLQPFSDGNKRTGRILANAILYSHNSFPLSLRAVDVNTYKLAIIAFYELGTLGNSKKVFIDQAKYSADNYAI